MKTLADNRMTIVRSRMLELQAEATQARLASTARAAHTRRGIRRRFGRGLVAGGAALAHDGIVEGTGEPIAHVTGAQRPINPYTDPCLDVRSGLGRAL